MKESFLEVALFLLSTSLVLGFAPTLPPSTLRSSSRNRGTTASFPIFSLQFLADAEKEGLDKEAWEKSWIPTSNGGFLPKLKRKKNVVHEITTMQDYKTMVAQENEKLVVVRFYAPWCRACKAIANQFQQLPQLYPDVKFVEVPLSKETGMIHQGLGVPSLPFGHIYHPEVGLVEERRISRQHFQDFRDQILQSYIDGECPVKYDEDATTNFHG